MWQREVEARPSFFLVCFFKGGFGEEEGAAKDELTVMTVPSKDFGVQLGFAFVRRGNAAVTLDWRKREQVCNTSGKLNKSNIKYYAVY